jgi:thiamine biosynthesis protein ThiS
VSGEAPRTDDAARTVQITVNSELHAAPADITVRALLGYLGIRQDRVAIERNLEILPRDRWEATRVTAGDRYEIVHFVGGG